MVMKNKYCPCCGAPIKVGQEECLNCRVYLWEVRMESNLKPCPFCGGKAIFLGGSLEDHRKVYIACENNCVEQCFVKCREEAIEAWNRRAPEIVKVETSFYDKEEVHENCTVQVLTNTATGDVSVGWWENDD